MVGEHESDQSKKDVVKGSDKTSIRLLLVEDDPKDARLLQGLLAEIKDEDFEFVWVDSLSKGLEYVSTENVDIVFLDLSLPDSQGLKTFTSLYDKIPDIPVVVLTTSDAEKDVTAAHAHNVNSYLVKPLDFAEFTKMLSDLGGYWLDWNIVPLQPSRVISSKTGN